MSWWTYVTEKSGGATQTEIAERTGLTQPTVNRWRTSKPKVDNVIAFARAYDRPVLEAFVAAEFLTEEQAQLTKVDVTAADLDTETLVEKLHEFTDELARRAKD